MDEGCFDRASMRDHQYYQNNFPSFSSTLLDSIYRSIDEAGGGHPHRQQQQPQTFFSYQETNTHINQDGDLKVQELQRAYEGEKWIDKKGNGKVVDVQWNSVANLRRSPRSFRNSSSSSSDSSSNRGGFSSSESDYSSRSESKSSSSCYSIKKLKPIRTSITVDRPDRPRVIDTLGGDDNFRVNQVNRPNVHKQEGGVVKAKSKAMKIYTEFKRASGNNNKQPVSPGAKLASFLNSLFNAKKGKVSAGENFPGKVPKSGYSSTCSSASSFSRSCLSKTPSSRGKFTNDGTKRSVRFCPVNMIVDEDSRPCGQKTVLRRDHQELDSRKNAVNKHQEVGQMAIKNLPEMREKNRGSRDEEDHENEEDDDDGASCASSDLFELENLSGIGIGIGGGYRYSEELPVYETTNLNTIRAVANSFIV